MAVSPEDRIRRLQLGGFESLPPLDRYAAMQDGQVTQDEIDASRARQDAAADARHSAFEQAMGLPAAQAPAPAAPAARPRYVPQSGLARNMGGGDENMERQWDQWQQRQKDFVAQHGVLPEEAANRAPTGMGGEVRVGGKVVKRTEAPTPERHAQNVQTIDRIKRNRWMREQANRFRNEIASGKTSMEELGKLYDAGAVANPGNRHLGGAVAALDTTNQLRGMQQAQRQLNVDARENQHNQARLHGVPRGFVAAQQSIDAAMAAGDPARASAIAATYGAIYGPAFTNWSEATNQRLGLQAAAEAKREPQKPGMMEQLPKDMAQIDAMPAGPNRLAMMRMHSANMLGEGAEPEAIEQQVRSRYQPHAQRLMAKPPDQWSNEERMEFMSVAGGMKYDDFYKYLGLEDSPQTQNLYRQLTGKYARDSWLVPNWLWNAVGGD